MTPQQLHDALDYLDDELILETDRKRCRHRQNRQLIRWLGAAACLAVFLVCGFMLKNARFGSPDSVVPEHISGTPTQAGFTDVDGAPPTEASEADPQAPVDGEMAALRITALILHWEADGFIVHILDASNDLETNTSVYVVFNEDIHTSFQDSQPGYNGIPTTLDFPEGTMVDIEYTTIDNTVTPNCIHASAITLLSDKEE